MTTFPQIAILGSLYQMIVGAGLYNRLGADLFLHGVYFAVYRVGADELLPRAAGRA